MRYTRWHSFDERFWGQIDVAGPFDCWNWTGTLTEKGYGRRIYHDGVVRYPHQVAYILRHGPIPEGLVIDHLCRNRRCANAAHLEAVTNEENLRRGREARRLEGCPNGHDPSHRRQQPSGRFECGECAREGGRRYYERRRAEVLARRRERYATHGRSDRQ